MYPVSIVVGTKPELIKMAPVIRRLKSQKGFLVEVIYSGQSGHEGRDMARSFGIEFDAELSVLPVLDVSQSVAGVLEGFSAYLRRRVNKPEIMLVHGGSNTAMAVALGCFYAGVVVGHVEAGVRRYFEAAPHPDEANSKMIGQIASMHFAPTTKECGALLLEGVRREDIVVTGNTIVDQVNHLSVSSHDMAASLGMDFKSDMNGDGNAADRIFQSIMHSFEFGTPTIPKFLEFR